MLFIFDENFPRRFVQGFSILEKANRRSLFQVEVVFSVDFMGGSKIDPITGERLTIQDEEIILKASEQDAVIITHDSDFKRIKHYRSLLMMHKAGFIYFRTPKKYTYWDYVKAFVNSWEEIKEKVSNASHPFAFEVSKQGHLKRLEF